LAAAREGHRQRWPYFLHNTSGVGLRAAVTGRKNPSEINERANFGAFIICPKGEKYFTVPGRQLRLMIAIKGRCRRTDSGP
jgi:hypothetical protein